MSTRTDWPTARLHVVTGKGGTGKTTVAAAVALALAADGKRTLLVEVEGRQGIAQLFDVPPLPYEERKIGSAPRRGEVWALAVDAEEALLDYLEMFYRLGRAGKLLKVRRDRLRHDDRARCRDVLLTGKVKESVTRMERGHRRYDAVVLDAPPTGRIGRFLNVTSEVAGLAKVGPIKTQSDGVAAVLHSPLTAVHVVTLLEEMPVQETADAIVELGELSLPVGSVIVNQMREPRLAGTKVTQAELKRGLAAVGLPVDRGTLTALVEEATDYRSRVELEQRLQGELEALERPLLRLPFLPDGIDLGGLYELAETLIAQVSSACLSSTSTHC